MPAMSPGEEILKTSPDVTVKNTLFDAFLTNKRIIFAKKTDDLYAKKELVFPVNLVRKYDPASDQSGTPIIDLGIQKPDGSMGELILKFSQNNGYRYAERDEWIDLLKRINSGAPMGHAAPQSNPYSPAGNTAAAAGMGMGMGAAAGSMGQPGMHGGMQGGMPPQNNFGQRPPMQNQGPHGMQGGMPPQNNFGQRPPMQNAGHPGMPGGMQGGMPPQNNFGQRPPMQNQGPQGMQGGMPPQNNFGQRPPMQNQGPQGRGGMPGGMPPQNDGFGQRPPMQNQGPQGRGGMPGGMPQQNNFGQRPPMQNREPQGRGGYSLADDPEFAGQNRGRRGAPQDMPLGMDPAMKKRMREEEKRRAKEEKLAEKERKKAMKQQMRGGGYDDYGYKESRMPDVKIIAGVVLAIIVIAVVAVVFMNGGLSLGGSSGSSGSGSSGSSSGTPVAPGSTKTSESYGTWNIDVYCPGVWTGKYTVDGVEHQFTMPDGSTTMEGTVNNVLIYPTGGTITVTATKAAEAPFLDIDIQNEKSQTKGSASSTQTGSNTVTATVTL